MAGQGSAANVIAAVCSFLIPGLGQLVQGRLLGAVFYLVLTGVLWLVSLGFLGWLGHVVAALDAALWRPPAED